LLLFLAEHVIIKREVMKMTIGENIRYVRQSKGMTQKQLGKLAGIAEPTIRRYELGKLNPKRETIQKIANALGVNMLDLMGIGSQLDQYVYEINDVVVPDETSPLEKERKSREVKNLFSELGWRGMYDMLSSEDKKIFWEMAADDATDSARKRMARNPSEENPGITVVREEDTLPDDVKKVAIRYSKLDTYGKAAVQAVMGEEEARIKDQTELDFPLTEPEPKVIPLYWSAAAAGIASPILGDDYDHYELKPEDPQGAVFAIKVQGDSMEPYFPDGSIAFCNRDPMGDGDIGVFYLDGESFIKQYHYDRVMGMTYLFSLNRDRADADKLITRTSGHTLVCFGRVITRRRYPLPR